MYSLSNKQLKSLAAGHPVSVALPPPRGLVETADNVAINQDRLYQWVNDQLPGLGRAVVMRATLQTVWLDCSGGMGGLTEFYGIIVPDIARHSTSGLPPIPVSVVVCEIVPLGYKGLLAERIQWPGEYVSQTGYGYGGNHEDRFVPVANPV